MKLLVIVLCLICERFFIHTSVHQRFSWFNNYSHSFGPAKTSASWLKLIWLVVPPLLVIGLLFYLFANWLFGFIGLIFNIVILHYCFGPGNAFYPNSYEQPKSMSEVVGDYLAMVNGQLFAVIFWYIVLGPLGAMAYRLISLCQKQDGVQSEATWLTDILDWVPAKMTALLYLLVGNFQAGFEHFSRFLLAAPDQNQTMLSLCGLEAVGDIQQEQVLMPRAETLVEHALVVLLVLIAIFTIAAWL